MDAVNKLTYTEFIEKFGNVVQACPLVAATLWSSRPFASSDDLIEKLCDFIDSLPLPSEYNDETVRRPRIFFVGLSTGYCLVVGYGL